MAAGTFRVKLYGYSGNDPDTFCRNLSALLAIPPKQARSILDDLRDGPVVLAEGFEQKAAEKLQELLQSKQGLCLLEPEQEETQEAAAVIRGAWSPVLGRAEPQPLEEKTPLATKLLLIGLACAISVLVVYLGSGFIGSVTKIRRENPRDVQRVEPQEQPPDEESQIRPSRAALNAEQAVQERVREIEERLNELQSQLTIVDDYLGQHVANLMAGKPEYEERKQKARELRRDIFLLTSELETIKRRIEMSGGSPP